MQILAFALAFLSAVLAYGGSAMQALEAREVPQEQSLRAGLLLALVRRPLWVGGTLLNVLAFGVQVVALALASLAVVQPTLALGLVVLVLIAVWKLDEPFEARTGLGIAAIIAGLVGLALVAPKRDRLPEDTTSVVVVVAALALVVALLVAMRVLDRKGGLLASVGAGLSYAWLAFAGALAGEAYTRHAWTLAAVWALVIVVAAVVAVTAEMTALQTWPVSRSKPVVFVLQTLLPAFAAPFFSRHGFGAFHGIPFSLALLVVAAGAALVASSGAVATAQG